MLKEIDRFFSVFKIRSGSLLIFLKMKSMKIIQCYEIYYHQLPLDALTPRF